MSDEALIHRQTTVIEWQAGREAIEEYAERLGAKPDSCQLFEKIISSFDKDPRVHRYDIMRTLLFTLKDIHTSHDDADAHIH